MTDFTRDPVALGRRATIATFASLAGSVAFAAASGYQFSVLSGLDDGAVSDEGYAALGNVATIAIAGVAVLYTVANLVAAVLILTWVYRVNRNAHALSDAMEVSPGWNVGWFFVPIANLWKPFQGVRQAWQVSHEPDDPYGVAVPGVLRLWWGLWLASSMLGNLSFRLSLKAETVSDDLQSAGLQFAITAVDVPLAFALAWVVTRLSAAQSRALRQRVFA